jgi:hypothetical protein
MAGSPFVAAVSVCVRQIMMFKPGDTIIRKGDHGDSFYMIKAGRVVCTGIGSGATVRVRLLAPSFPPPLQWAFTHTRLRVRWHPLVVCAVVLSAATTSGVYAR